MVFQNLDDNSNETAYKLGLSIYQELLSKYPERTEKDLDVMLNSLCMALTCLIRQSVAKDNRNVIIQMVHKIITQNC